MWVNAGLDFPRDGNRGSGQYFKINIVYIGAFPEKPVQVLILRDKIHWLFQINFWFLLPPPPPIKGCQCHVRKRSRIPLLFFLKSRLRRHCHWKGLDFWRLRGFFLEAQVKTEIQVFFFFFFFRKKTGNPESILFPEIQPPLYGRAKFMWILSDAQSNFLKLTSQFRHAFCTIMILFKIPCETYKWS